MPVKDVLREVRNHMSPDIWFNMRRVIKYKPMISVINILEQNNLRLRELDALEVFGKDGAYHTVDYGYAVSSLEIWEIDPVYKERLAKNFPHATIKIVDSYYEIKNVNRTFGMIVVDNPMSTYGDYCEHFKLFPDIFRILSSPGIIVLNVIPEIDEDARNQYPYIFNDEHLKIRSSFYSTSHPEKVTIDEMIDTYDKLAGMSGFKLYKHYSIKRSFVYYLVLLLKKIEA